ncbi:MAG: hypothetical protein DSY37_02455 [Hyperthermus sp.]|nr:MAG: hypothetical protein DSY37_02455 [Hyperthermus sp.]
MNSKQEAVGKLLETGPFPVLHAVVSMLQEKVNGDYDALKTKSTCSREFISWLESLESMADKELLFRGFEKLASTVPRRDHRDLALGYYRVGEMIVEVGLEGLNKCGQLLRLTGGRPPRVYAKIYSGELEIAVIRAGEEEVKEQASLYIM